MDMLLVRFQIKTKKTAEACMCCPYPQTVTKPNNGLYIIYVTTVHCTSQPCNP